MNNFPPFHESKINNKILLVDNSFCPLQSFSSENPEFITVLVAFFMTKCHGSLTEFFLLTNYFHQLS